MVFPADSFYIFWEFSTDGGFAPHLSKISSSSASFHISRLLFCFKGQTHFSMANRHREQCLLSSVPRFFSFSVKCGAQTHWGFSARVRFCGHLFVPVHPSSSRLLHLFQCIQSIPPYCQPTLSKTFCNSSKIYYFLCCFFFFLIFIT